MSKKARTTRLLLRADKAAALKAKGYLNIHAWREVTPNWQQLAPNDQHRAAWEFFHHHLVAPRIAAAMQLAAVQAMDSHGRFHNEVIEDIAAARHDGNWTAVMQGHRIRGSSGHYLSETLTVNDRRHDDKQLLADLRKLMPELSEAAAARLLAGDGFVTPDVTPEQDKQTKH